MTHLTLDHALLQQHFPQKPFKLTHNLQDHPLFTIESLLELSKRLPEKSVEYNAGDLPIEQDPQQTPTNGLSIQDTIARIEHCHSWLVLKNVEQDLDYNAIMQEALDMLNPYSDAIGQQKDSRESFIFISSPKAVTPFHIDPEHNFLLQIHGEKTMHQWDPLDREVMPEEEIENTYCGEHPHRNLPYKESFASKALSFKLAPGDALHVPVHAPHWVQNGNQVSVSYSITFRSSVSQRNLRLHYFNAWLRSRGLKPSNVGTHNGMDIAKDYLYRSAIKAKSLVAG